MHFENPSQATILKYLATAKVIAVVGYSENSDKTSHQIAQLLKTKGYTIYGVNPKLDGQTVAGIQVVATLADVPEHIDIVDIFRRSEFLPQVAKDFFATDAKVFWAQLGLSSEEAAAMLQEQGCNDIVMDRCIKIELAKMV